MGNLFVLAVLVGLFVIIAPIALIAITNGQGGRLARLEAQNTALSDKLKHLERLYVALLAAPPARSAQAMLPDTAQPQSAAEAAPTISPAPPTIAEPAPPPATEPAVQPDERGWVDRGSSPTAPANGWVSKPAVPPSIPPAVSAKKPFDWERFMGVNLPVWLGALALSMAGFFFVRYSIEIGLFTPTFRVIGGLIAALGFLLAAELVRQRVRADNGPAIAAALAAAAIATLYATAYIASILYGLVPQAAGFVAMAAVTAVAIGIALIYGQSVAIVGLLGGYVTPALFASDEPSAAILFGYLTAIFIGMFTLIRLKNWWNISLVALLGPALWIFAWSFDPGFATDHIWGSAFLIVLAAIVLVAALPFWVDDTETVGFGKTKGQVTVPRQAIALTFALSSLGFLVFLAQSGFALPFWQGHIVFSVLVVALAFIWPRAMRYMPILPLAATAVALVGWDFAYPEGFGIIVALSAAIFGFAALDQFRRLQQPAFWAGNLAFVALFFFAIALFKLTGWQAVLEQAHFWAFGALVLAAAFLLLLWRFGPAIADEKQRNSVHATLGATTTAFLSLAIVIELDPLYFPAAAALQVLGLAFIYRRVPLPALRFIAGALSIAYGLLILGVATGGSLGLFNYDVEAFLFAASLSDSPWVLLILPGLAFLGAGTLFRRKDPDGFADCLDIAGIAMAALGLFILGRGDTILLTDAHIGAANVLLSELALAALALFFGRVLARSALYVTAIILTVLVIIGMALALVFPVYFFWPAFDLPGITVLNVALLSLGLPSIVLLGIGWFIRNDAHKSTANLGRAVSIIAVFFLFTLMLLDIRHAFHPLDLQGEMSSAEYYAYSIGMLTFGAALLIIGVVFRNVGARALSFVFVLAATIKVFMFDAAALEGLWRVLSFFGMGVAFLAISWLYARFVFGLGRKSGEQASPAT